MLNLFAKSKNITPRAHNSARVLVTSSMTSIKTRPISILEGVCTDVLFKLKLLIIVPLRPSPCFGERECTCDSPLSDWPKTPRQINW